MPKFNLLQFGIICLLAMFVTFLALGKSYPTIYSPLDPQGAFTNIDYDRWIVDGAEIRFANLLNRGNKLSFYFSKWQPEDLARPQVQVFVCDRLVSQFEVFPGLKQDVYLKGNCEPRVVRIQSPNPIIASVTDSRPLIAKLDHLELQGKQGMVLPSLFKVGQVASTIVLLAMLATIIVSGILGWGLVALILIGSYFLIEQNYFSNLIVLGNFYACLGLFFLGLLVAKLNLKTSLQFPYFPRLTSTSFVLISCAFVCGAILRFYDIDFGLPANYHPDEVPKYNAIQRMRHYEDLNPRYFLHPTLLLYSAYFFNNILRFFTSPDLPWMDTLILAGRMMSATAGSLSIILTALIANKLFNKHASVIAAFLIAVFPLHVTCSRYLKEDALLVFFILLAVYFVVRSIQEDRPAALLLAGLAAGFSASVKYTGLVSMMILVGAPFLRSESLIPNKHFLKWTIRAIFLLPLGFLLASPYTLLDRKVSARF